MATSKNQKLMAVDKEVWQMVKRAAEMRGVSMAELMRLPLQKVARKVLREAEAAFREDPVHAAGVAAARSKAAEVAQQLQAPVRAPAPAPAPLQQLMGREWLETPPAPLQALLAQRRQAPPPKQKSAKPPALPRGQRPGG